MRMTSSSKGLSQILYLIIAASVLMMIAMVITFTATDIIGGAGGQATENTCTKALEGKCATFSGGSSTYVTVPSTCSREGQWVGAVAGTSVKNNPSVGSSTCSTPGASSCSGEVYVDCSTL